MKGKKEEGGRWDWQRIKANQSEGGGGQTRAETDLSSSCHIAFNLTEVQLFKRDILLKVVRSERFKVTPLSLSLSVAAAGGAAAGRTAAAAVLAFPSPCLHHPSPTLEQVSRADLGDIANVARNQCFPPVKYQFIHSDICI